jgi:hypothetical protein
MDRSLVIEPSAKEIVTEHGIYDRTKIKKNTTVLSERRCLVFDEE